MQRGDVHLIVVDMPNREGPGTVQRSKYVVVLRGVDSETEVPVVVAGSKKTGAALRGFEVEVGPEHGFQHATKIDCRWPFTIMKSDLTPNTYRFTLPREVMREVSIALVVGLEMHL